MSPEQFLRKQFRDRLETVELLSQQTENYKIRMADYCVMLWKQTHHKGEDAIKAAMGFAKKNANKRVNKK